jgi:(p)ppGpp synthase/HD superfamily hydrolase
MSTGGSGAVVLGPNFGAALTYAWRAHADQFRKGSQVSYVGHLLGVASLVIEDGGSENEAIAALLHDAPEDQGGQRRLDDIGKLFGPRVFEIVEACSDTLEAEKPEWKKRKQDYLDHLAVTTDQGVLRVSLADKLYNARAIVGDLRDIGDQLWKRFRAGRDQQLWYYGELAEIYARQCPGSLAEEFGRTVDQMRTLRGAHH